MIILTNDLIKSSFSETGLENEFLPVYMAEAKRCYDNLQKDEPDDEYTPDEFSNALWSLNHTKDYIIVYVQEIKKGHSASWAASFAKDTVYDEREPIIVKNALDTIDNKEDKEKEFEIHVNSLNLDPIFKERYKVLIDEYEPNARAMAEEYLKVYYRCVENGKSEAYSKAYADYANQGIYEEYCEVYAEAYEIAFNHEMKEIEAQLFGSFCSDAKDHGFILMLADFKKQYKEDWQKDFYLHLLCVDYEESEKRCLTKYEIEDIKKELYQ